MAPTRRSTRRSKVGEGAEPETPQPGAAEPPAVDAPPAVDEPPVEPSAPPDEASAPPDESPAPKKPRRRKPKPEPVPAAPEPEAGEPAPVTPSRRRVLVTGGSGFVGRAVVRAFLDRGDRVVVPVRDRGRVADLAEAGAEILEDDLSDIGRLSDAMRDVDAVVHVAGRYRVGIRREERGAMWDANVGTTTRVLDAAEAAHVGRIVYVSTVNVFGNTDGQVVDESYRRDLRDGFLSWYDETKYGAHEVAERRIADGQPIVVVLPSQVYGPGDHSAFGDQLRRAHAGRLRYAAADDVGVGLVHVDDLAAGIVAALDRGRIGQSYVLSGPRTRLRDAVALAAGVGGQRPPRLRVPTALLRRAAPVGRLVGQPNLREVVSASAGVTYWASSAKAEAELGFAPRDLETGLRDTFGRR